MRITIACPENMLADANALAAVLGFGAADLLTFQGLNWQDTAENRYTAASFDTSLEWVIIAQTELVRPVWDIKPYQINLAGAERAQASLIFWTGEGNIPQANTTTITAIGNLEGLEALALMGLTQYLDPSITLETI